MLNQVQHDLILAGSSAVENNKREHISTALDVTIDTLDPRTRSDFKNACQFERSREQYA